MGITLLLLVFESYSLMSNLNNLSNFKNLCFLSIELNRLHRYTYIHTYTHIERSIVKPFVSYPIISIIGTLNPQLVAGQGGKCSSAKALWYKEEWVRHPSRKNDCNKAWTWQFAKHFEEVRTLQWGNEGRDPITKTGNIWRRRRGSKDWEKEKRTRHLDWRNARAYQAVEWKACFEKSTTCRSVSIAF